MPKEVYYRKKRRERSDYTKEPVVHWFIYLIILVAAAIIIRTLTADRVHETVSVQDVPKLLLAKAGTDMANQFLQQ